jgi:hypothetical protein
LRDALQIAGDAVRLADESPGQAGNRYPVRVTLGLILIALGQHQNARSALAAGLRISEELGARWPLPSYHVFLAFERFVCGEWDDAVAELEAATADIGQLYLAGASLGVRLAASQWLKITGLILVGLAPFVILGFVLGYLMPVDALPPALGGIVVLFSLFGGVYGFELAKSGHVRRDEGTAVLLARAGREGRSGWRRLAGGGVAGDRSLDRRPAADRRVRLPAHYGQGLTGARAGSMTPTHPPSPTAARACEQHLLGRYAPSRESGLD